MTEDAWIKTVPRAARQETLEAVVVAEFKSALLMADDEEIELDASFFDLGLTSLLVVDIKDRLEKQLGCAISANTLFNSPTIERLVEYLAEIIWEESSDHASRTRIE